MLSLIKDEMVEMDCFTFDSLILLADCSKQGKLFVLSFTSRDVVDSLWSLSFKFLLLVDRKDDATMDYS